MKIYHLQSFFKTIRYNYNLIIETLAPQTMRRFVTNKNDLISNIKEIVEQAPNRTDTWTKSQMRRGNALSGLRFEGVNLKAQPKPLAGMMLLSEVPIEMVDSRSVSCDGGGNLGHPRVYINLVGL